MCVLLPMWLELEVLCSKEIIFTLFLFWFQSKKSEALKKSQGGGSFTVTYDLLTHTRFLSPPMPALVSLLLLGQRLMSCSHPLPVWFIRVKNEDNLWLLWSLSNKCGSWPQNSTHYMKGKMLTCDIYNMTDLCVWGSLCLLQFHKHTGCF